jgi:hypothetical protein
MGISINSKMSGFRKWAEIHQPKKIDQARFGTDGGGIIAAADVRHEEKTPDERSARNGKIFMITKLKASCI